jgi:hypothetical protein
LNQRLANCAANEVTNPLFSVGGETTSTTASWPAQMLTTPPPDAFSGNLRNASQGPVLQSLVSAEFTADTGNISCVFNLQGTGGNTQPARPQWQDPVSGDFLGYMIFGSDPVEQQGLAVVNPYRNLLGSVSAPGGFSGSYTPTNTFELVGNVPLDLGRKSFYSAGQTMRISVFAVSISSGQTQMIGARDIVVS